MAEFEDNDEQDTEDDAPSVSWLDDPRIVKIRKERAEVLSSVAGQDYSTVRNRVAALLNIYPQARNSDVTLAIKYWETFQRDLYSGDGIDPKNLFKLERMTTITRVRAKIQNDYGLFQSDPSVRHRRKQREEEVKDDVLADAEPRRLVSVFSDETGKNGAHVVVASVWVLNGRAVFEISQEIADWRKGTPFEAREIHFARFRRDDVELVRTYLDLLLAHRGYLSFKAIAAVQAGSRRSVEEIVQRLHEFTIVEGVRHEHDSHRFDLPRTIKLTIDDEDSLDDIALRDIRRNASQDLERRFGRDVSIDQITKANSRHSELIQLADVIAGAINRRLNHVGDRNYKDEIADMLIDALGLHLDQNDVPGIDTAVLLNL